MYCFKYSDVLLMFLLKSGRWLSPTMPARYARGQLATRGAVARLRFGQ